MMSIRYVEIAILCGFAAAFSWVLSGLLPSFLFRWGDMNIWYDADIPRVFMNMTDRTQGHSASYKHPLFALLLWPPTTALTQALGDPWAAVRAILALNAAIATLLVQHVAGILAPGVRAARWIAALLFMSSAAFVFWFGAPETFAFGATSILVALCAAAIAARGPTLSTGAAAALGAAAILALSMTITNVAVAVMGLAIGFWLGRDVAEPIAARAQAVLISLVKIGAPAIFVAVCLAVLQDRTFGDAGLFFNPVGLLGERQFVDVGAGAALSHRPVILTLGAFVVGLPVEVPFVNAFDTGNFEVVKLNQPVYLVGGPAHWLAIGLFCVVAIWSAVNLTLGWRAGALSAAARAVTLTALAALGFFIVMHMIYGAEVFLYVAHLLPPIVALIVAGVFVRPAPALLAAASLLIAVSFWRNVTEFVFALDLAARVNG